ncbi:GNAT family N-acetyltransferase [Paenibacillus sp. WLX2291]|uniref:GNAT family N-acetyltransferase n=1 Tax=Paenibacillus sp. WLX2291 TaxID=3296934 RepID=UPI003983DFDC
MKLHTLQFKQMTKEAVKTTASFYSGNSTMDSFLRENAYYYHITREASTTLVYYDDQLIAYYTLTRNLFDGVIDNLAKQEHLWALDLSRLAVVVDFQNKGVGSFIIKHIIDLAQRINDRFITTDALFEKWEWYHHFGFDYLVESDINPITTKGLVYMLLDLYDPNVLEDYFDE